MKLMKIRQFREEFFTEGSAPDIKTIKKAIEDGDLAGKKIGAAYFIDVDKLLAANQSSNPLVQRVLG